MKKITFELVFLLLIIGGIFQTAQADNIADIKAQIANLKNQSTTKLQEAATQEVTQKANDSKIADIKTQIDQKQKILDGFSSQLTTLQQTANNLSSTATQAITTLQNAKNDNVGGPLGDAKKDLNAIASGIDDVVALLKKTGRSDADIDKVFKDIGIDPKGFAKEIHGMADQIKPMNLSELQNWRNQLEKERAKAQKSKDDTEAKASQARADLAKNDAEIHQKEADVRFWETKRDENNREADRIAHTCGWWPWCWPGILWNKTAAATNQTIAWATGGNINLLKAWRFFPQLTVTANDVAASPYTTSVEVFTKQRDAVDKMIAGINNLVSKKQSDNDKVLATNKQQQIGLLAKEDSTKSDMASLQQKINALKIDAGEADASRAEAQALEKQASDLQKTLDSLNAKKIQCQGVVVSADEWRGAYYANTDLSGEVVFVRAEGVSLDLQNALLSPGVDCGVPVKFSVSLTKTQHFDNDKYHFLMAVNGGFRLYIDGAIKLDHWVFQGESSFDYDTSLTSGNHTLLVEYAAVNGIKKAKARLTWAPVPKPQTTPPILQPSTSSTNLPQENTQPATTCPTGSTYSYTFRQCMSSTPTKRSAYDGLPCPTGSVPNYQKVGCIP